MQAFLMVKIGARWCLVTRLRIGGAAHATLQLSCDIRKEGNKRQKGSINGMSRPGAAVGSNPARVAARLRSLILLLGKHAFFYVEQNTRAKVNQKLSLLFRERNA
jgi:hypothetical protein